MFFKEIWRFLKEVNDLKIYISADLEGTCCVVGEAGKPLIPGSKQYEFARRELTQEVNSAIEALKECGVEEILVDDEHDGGTEILIYEDLLPGIKIFLGNPRHRRFPALDSSFDGMILIGYHPMAGVESGILSHSYSSTGIQRMWLNGVEIGEIGLDASLAGALDVPVIFVSSCSKGVEEARKILGDIETVTVKEGFGRNCALSLHPKDAQKLIYEGVKRAIQRIGEFKPLKFSPPFELKIEFKLESLAEEEAKKIGVERIDPRTIVRRSNNIFDLIG